MGEIIWLTFPEKSIALYILIFYQMIMNVKDIKIYQ